MDTVAWLRPARLFVMGGLLIVAGAVASFWMTRQFFGTNFSSDDGSEYGLYVAIGTTGSETLRLLGVGVVLIGLARLVFRNGVGTPPSVAPAEHAETENPDSADASDDAPVEGTSSRSAPESLEIGGRVVDPPAPDDPAADRLWSRHGS